MSKPERRHAYVNPVMSTERWTGFTHRPGDIFVCTSYKAGTTWTQTICALLVFQTPELPAALSDLSPWIEVVTRPIDEVLADYEAQRHRRFVKTHTPLDGIPYREDATYLYCGRDPRDVFMSMLSHIENQDEERLKELQRAAGIEPEEGPPLPDDPDELFRMWLTTPSFEWEKDGFPWWSHFSHLKTYWDFRHLPNLHFLHYGDLKTDLEGQMRRVAGLLGIEVEESRWPALVEGARFDTVKANPEKYAPEANVGLWKDTSKFFNKGTTGQWQDVLSEDSLALYEEVKRDRLPEVAATWLEQGSLVCGDPKDL
jgi:aryl sulfotransferase